MRHAVHRSAVAALWFANSCAYGDACIASTSGCTASAQALSRMLACAPWSPSARRESVHCYCCRVDAYKDTTEPCQLCTAAEDFPERSSTFSWRTCCCGVIGKQKHPKRNC